MSGRFNRKRLYDPLKNIQSDKSPGNDGLRKEFYETFENGLKKIFVDSVPETKEKGHAKYISKTGYPKKKVNRKKKRKR